MNLGESLAESHAYNPIRDSRRDFSRQRGVPEVLNVHTNEIYKRINYN